MLNNEFNDKYNFICNENDDSDDEFKEDQEFGKGLNPDNNNDDENEK
jgi:hypothetical protein